MRGLRRALLQVIVVFVVVTVVQVILTRGSIE